jgi:hypothetical protein
MAEQKLADQSDNRRPAWCCSDITVVNGLPYAAGSVNAMFACGGVPSRCQISTARIVETTSMHKEAAGMSSFVHSVHGVVVSGLFDARKGR